jgi:hypothetical protein
VGQKNQNADESYYRSDVLHIFPLSGR